jgi:hypothetical protein
MNNEIKNSDVKSEDPAAPSGARRFGADFTSLIKRFTLRPQ